MAPPRRPIVACFVLGLICLAVIFFRECRAAVEVWNASTAYSHCYLVLPMTLYLLWERREVLKGSRASPEPRWALVAIAITVFWLAAERLGFMEGRQLAAIAGLQLLCLTILGRRLFARISGPLLFLFFLVPFGAFVTPLLQRFTADFTIVGLNLLGIPNYADKFIIETPAGTFFVAEACAGLRFLIAAIAFGVFYALLSYTSRARRLTFILASIIVPIIANGFRALGIVVLGQVLGSAEAAAADHIVYGWVFFSIVMLLLIAAGQLFREEPAPSRPIGSTTPLGGRGAAMWGVSAVIALLVTGPVTATVIDMRSSGYAARDMEVLDLRDGCSRTESVHRTQPGRQTTIVCAGTAFDVTVDVFAPRSTASAMVAQRRRVTQEIGAEDTTSTPVSLPSGAGAWTLVQTTDPNRVTAYASWVDGEPTRSGFAGRLAQARNSLLGSDYEPALVTITTAEPARMSPEVRKATLDGLVGLLQAQSNLNKRMATLTRVGLPP